MSYRTAQIYITYKTLARLRRSVELYPKDTGRPDHADPLDSAKETADERADRLLNEAINQQYPDVVELEKQMAILEKDFMKKRKEKKDG